jgi:hypothetical protein
MEIFLETLIVIHLIREIPAFNGTQSFYLVITGDVSYLVSLHPEDAKYWATRQLAIAKTPAKLSVYQIPSVIVVFIILVFKV